MSRSETERAALPTPAAAVPSNPPPAMRKAWPLLGPACRVAADATLARIPLTVCAPSKADCLLSSVIPAQQPVKTGFLSAQGFPPRGRLGFLVSARKEIPDGAC